MEVFDEKNRTEAHPIGDRGVVCATRGGQGSEPTVAAAIATARERGEPLTFLYIADLEFMRHALMGARTDLAAEEMRKMGEFIMLTLVEQAQKQGVEADFAVRKGRFRDELIAYLQEMRPSVLVLGRPKPETAYLDPDTLARLIEEIQTQTGVSVISA
ncbi:MAG TPA: universal stress protein [Chloroflexi bacterium]|nr:universal stress protein [Chloroflexota bacterium]